MFPKAQKLKYSRATSLFDQLPVRLEALQGGRLLCFTCQELASERGRGGFSLAGLPGLPCELGAQATKYSQFLLDAAMN